MVTREPVLKPRIVLFEKEKDYRDYAFNAVSAAHYVSLPQRDYIAMGPAESERNRRVAVHEYVHLLVRYAAPSACLNAANINLPGVAWGNEHVPHEGAVLPTSRKQRPLD